MIRDILGYSGSPGTDLFCQLLHAVCNFWIFGARPRPTVWISLSFLAGHDLQRGAGYCNLCLWRTCELLACSRISLDGEVVPVASFCILLLYCRHPLNNCQVWHCICTATITALDLAISMIFAECLCYSLYQTPHLCVIFCKSYMIFGKNLDLACSLQDLRPVAMVGVLLLSWKMLTEVGSNTFKQDLKRTLACTYLYDLFHSCSLADAANHMWNKSEQPSRNVDKACQMVLKK